MVFTKPLCHTLHPPYPLYETWLAAPFGIHAKVNARMNSKLSVLFKDHVMQ